MEMMVMTEKSKWWFNFA